MTHSIIRSFSVDVFATPLKRPFVTALGRKTAGASVGFTMTLQDKTRGYGEASASLALAHLKPGRLAAVLASLGRGAVGKDAAAHRPLIEDAWGRYGKFNPAASAFECALLDAWTRSRGLTLAGWFGGKLGRIETDITLSAWDDPEMTRAAAAEAAAEGFRIFKVKVAGDFAKDIERVRIAHRARRGPPIVIDGNQGLTVGSALRLVETCLEEGIQVVLLEQPLGQTDFKGMARLTKRCPVPVAADEMVKTPQDAVKVSGERAASAVNIKVAKSGLLRSLDIAAIARSAGMRLMVGCMSETAAGLKHSVHLALGTGFFSWVDLDSDHLLKMERGDCGWEREGPFLSLPPDQARRRQAPSFKD